MLTAKVGKVGRVCVCGMKGVGKTTLLEQLIYGSTTIEMHPTIEDMYVASVDTGRGTRETLRIFDTAGLIGNKAALPTHYLYFPEGYVLVYDPSDPSSLDMLASIKGDIDKNRDKKEVPIIVLANVHTRREDVHSNAQHHTNPIDTIISRANSWCARERIQHYIVNAMERSSLYEPFISLCARLHPPQTKSTFPQLRQVMQKTQKNEN